MRSTGILLKYYSFSIFLGLIFGFNQYAFKIDIPMYITGPVTALVLWGFIYSALKTTDGTYNLNQMLMVSLGVALPNALVVYFFPKVLGLTSSSNIVAAPVLFFIGLLCVYGFFALSKNMIQALPVDDYDS